MLQLGAFHTLEVTAEKPFGMLLGDGSVVLARRHMPQGCAVGDRLEVFVYEDAEGQTVATTHTPKGRIGDFACLEVLDRTQHGVFMDWGVEKDLFVPRQEQAVDMYIGDHHVVVITTDKQGRVMGSSRIRDFLDDDVSEVEVGRNVDVMAYEAHERGMKVIVDGRWEGLIYKTEIYRDLHPGDRLEGIVATVRDDAKLDIDIRERGVAAMSAGKDQLLEALRANNGFLPLHDKSSPEDIRARLHVSKKAFKRAVGNLLRAGLVRLDNEGIRLL